jgi:pimeloyl-ACP methyl ester carboxylesterase
VEVREGYIFSNDATLRYISWSPKDEPRGLAVLYHGFGGSSEMMGWIGFELARKGYLAVSYDARGHGKSSSSLSHNVSALLQDFYLIREKFNCSYRETLLIGHSMGGSVAQELASSISPSKIVVIASPPLNRSISSEKLLILAGLDEIFPRNRVMMPAGWHVYVSALDDHLTILYSPNAIDRIIGWLSGNSETIVLLRLILTLISSISAIFVLILTPAVLVGRREIKVRSDKGISAKTLLFAALLSPISFLFFILLTNLIRAPIASFILGIFYSQALGLSLQFRKNLAKIKWMLGEIKLSSAGLGLLLALFTYLMMHSALQPFLNVEPSTFRLTLIIELLLLFTPAILMLEILIPENRGEFRKILLQRLALMLTSFISALLVFQILIGEGYAGYFLIVTYMSLVLLIPIELLASVLASRGLETMNFIWIPVVLALLLGAVTPIT